MTSVRSASESGSDSDSENPLQSTRPGAWTELIDAVGPAAMLVVIESRMGPALQRRISAEDIWQDTLLHAWRDRGRCKWTDVDGFRRWLLGILDHRIHDTRDFFAAAKRGGGMNPAALRITTAGSSTWHEEPLRSTTPSRMAIHREQANHMRLALSDVPDDCRDIVRLRLFEGLMMEQVADAVGIGLSAAKHRFRKGAARYRESLFRRLGTRTSGSP